MKLKNKIGALLIFCLALGGCSSSQKEITAAYYAGIDSEALKTPADSSSLSQGDTLFLSNLAAALGVRWRLLDSYYDDSSYESAQISAQSILRQEQQMLGDLEDYEFSDPVLKAYAALYLEALELQLEGIPVYAKTQNGNWRMEDTFLKTYDYGLNLRVLTIDALQERYGLKIPEDVQEHFTAFLALKTESQQRLSAYEFVQDLSQSLEFSPAQGTGETIDYSAQITNESQMVLEDLYIEVQVMDKQNAVVHQELLHYTDLYPNDKVNVSFAMDAVVSYDTIEVNCYAIY